MGELMIWLLVAAVLGLLAGGLLWRRRTDARRAEAEGEAQRRADEAAAEARHLATERAEAERVATAEREARRQAALRAEQQRQAAEAQRRVAEQGEAQRQAELRAEQQRRSAEQAQADRAATESAARTAQAERQRQAAEQAERERVAAATAAAAAEREAKRLAAEQAALPPPRTPKSASQTLVLVADDSKVVRIKTGRLLAQHQYQVSYASDGLDAVQQMQAQMPDVLITDVEMPGIDGFELTRRIRGNPKTAQLPVIMITAADDRHRDEANAAGVSVLLGKPYSDEALIAHIRLAMGQDQTETAPA